MRKLILVNIFLGSFVLCFSQNLNYLKDTIQISKTSSQVVFDGMSNENVWQNAYPMEFTTFRPVWGGVPSEKTEMLVTFDEDNLYIAGRCFTRDSNTLVIRNLVRDGWRGDDWMTFHIDNTFDKQNALVFSIYPMGSRYDAAVANDAVDLGTSSFNQDFNMFWDARSVVNNEGWFFEIKIPLYNLRLRKNDKGQVNVGISAARILQNPQEMHIFPPIPQNILDGMSKPSVKQPAILLDLNPQKLLLVTPYLASSTNRAHLQNLSENKIESSRNNVFQAGMDLKIGINSYLTLDASVNPDFAQVEADDQLLNLTRFSLFFPEKRQFFQEAAGLFDFNLGGQTQMFYSRNIGINDGQLTSVYGGARLTGKLNANTDIGFLSMQAAPLRDVSDVLLRGSENFSTLRLRKKILNRQSFVGMMATHRAVKDGFNTALGLDMMLNPSSDHYFIAALGTTLDNAGLVGIETSRLNLRYELRKTDGIFGEWAYTYSGENFNPLSGFLDRSDFHQMRGTINYGKFSSDKSQRFQYLRYRILDANVFRSVTRNDFETVELSSSLLMSRFSGIETTVQTTYNYEWLYAPLHLSERTVVPVGRYHFGQLSFQYLEPRANNFRNFFTFSAGTFFNGRRYNLSYNPILNLGKHWEIQGTYSINHLSFGDVLETIHIGRVRLNYALNLHLSVNYVVQYNSINRQIFNNLRLRYNFNDGHDLYLVWNENFFTERQSPWGELIPVSGIQNFILKYNVTFDSLLKKS